MSYEVKVMLTIYVYVKNGKSVYVGQTRRALEQRDHEHMMRNTTKFEIDYLKHHDQFGPPVVLALMIRTHHFSSVLEEVKALYMWQNWMNEQEKYWIAHYGTYLSGLNQTRGGQMSYTVAMLQSKLKKNAEVWTKKYIPAFRSSD
jgi:hypothetical protein